MRNDSFLPGALILGYSLRKQKVKEALICLVTKDISENAVGSLKKIYDDVILIDEIYIEHKNKQERQDRPYLFTRFNALRLGADGDLGYSFEKIVVLDADILTFKNYSQLFELQTPAGIINETKDHVMEYDENGKYIYPDSIEKRGEWIWHDTYNSICPHGMLIPNIITDKVISDQTNLGVTAALWVISPSMSEFNQILKHVKEPKINELVCEKFNWVEQQYATMRWSGQWHNVDLKYASFRGYPNLEVLYGTHFAGVKPWDFKKKGMQKVFKRFPDYKAWHELYIEMLTSAYPEFMSYGKLRRLYDEICKLL